MRHARPFLFMTAMLVAVAVGCASQDPTPEPSPTQQPTPQPTATATIISPTQTPVPPFRIDFDGTTFDVWIVEINRSGTGGTAVDFVVAFTHSGRGNYRISPVPRTSVFVTDIQGSEVWNNRVTTFVGPAGGVILRPGEPYLVTHTWDGNNRRGDEALPGTYFARVKVDFSAPHRLLETPESFEYEFQLPLL